MTRTPRKFATVHAVREQVPLLVGCTGPSGGGKTFSMLRMATGIRRVRGGKVYVIDTEANRSKHYADDFDFEHLSFAAPFGSLDYLDALRWCAEQGAGVICVDSLSHEHEGDGGYLWLHESELDAFAGDDRDKRQKNTFRAWIKPAAHRRALINGLLQINAAFIFCFRAKEKTKPVKGGDPIELGFMPIAGDEFLFELTINFLLLPRANGVPTWQSDRAGERQMMKLPKQFKGLFDGRNDSLSEAHGEAMALWAKGGSAIRSAVAPTAAPIDGLMDRADKLARALKASTADKIEKTWTRAADLRKELQTANPSLLDELERLHEARAMELSEAAK